MKIWQEEEMPHQTTGFSLPDLPDQVFRLVVPELISDSTEDLLPWSHPSPQWDIDRESAHCASEISGAIRMSADVTFSAERIDIHVAVTNLSTRTWDNANLFTCFAYYPAPQFHDPERTRTHFPIAPGVWESVADLFAEHDPGPGPYTFFPVRGGPALSDLWVCRQINQMHSQQLSAGAACVLSSCGQWLAGMASARPAYVFNNRRQCCIHADPLLGTVAPGRTTHCLSTVHIFRGSLEDFDARLSG